MPAADRGGSTSVRGRIRCPHSSGDLQGSCDAADLGQVGQTDRRIAGGIIERVLNTSFTPPEQGNKRTHFTYRLQHSLIGLSYDDATVTIDLRRTCIVQNIL